MTPEEAAAILGVDLGADRETVEHAFVRQAKAWHPDRFAGADPQQAARVQAEFIRITNARNILLADLEAHEPPPVVRRPPPSWRLITAWTALALFAIFVAMFRYPAPFTVAEPIIRYGALMLAAIGYAATGWHPLFIVAIATGGLTVVVSLVYVSFGMLVGLFLLLPAVIALLVLGRRLDPLVPYHPLF